jgi:PadR family transcriptional regulator, regulatory protein AphA
MDPSLSPTARVILGMIRLGRRTGYDIKQLVDHSTRFFWAASYGQIYPELRRLEAAGLVEGRADATGGRQRTVYELTAAGERALEDWLTDPAELTYELRDEGLLKFFFADALSREQTIEHLRRMRTRHEATVGRLREIEPYARAERDEHGHEFPYLTLQGGIAYHGSSARWCREMEEHLVELASPLAPKTAR